MRVRAKNYIKIGKLNREVKRGEIIDVSKGYYSRHAHLFEPVEKEGKMDNTDYENKMVEPDTMENKGEEVYTCDYCGREFDTPQGKAAHERACDKA